MKAFWNARALFAQTAQAQCYSSTPDDSARAGLVPVAVEPVVHAHPAETGRILHIFGLFGAQIRPLVPQVMQFDLPRHPLFEGKRHFPDMATLLEPVLSGGAVGQGERGDIELFHLLRPCISDTACTVP